MEKVVKRFRTSKSVRINNAIEIVSMSDKYNCANNIYIRKISKENSEYRQVSIMSIIGLMSLDIETGQIIEIFSYDDSEEDIACITELINWFTTGKEDIVS